MYVRELSVSYRLRWIADGRPPPNEQVREPAGSARLLRALLGEEAVEVCGVLCLSTARRLIAYHCLSRGVLDQALVHPREVFKIALLANASAIIIGHNHPSGDCLPSRDDALVTTALLPLAS